jgi:hypothetical protein
VIKEGPKAGIIQQFLREYAKMTFSSAVMLLDDALLAVGSHATDEQYIEICEGISSWLVVAVDKIKRYNIKLGTLSGNLLFTVPNATATGDKKGLFFFHRFQIPDNFEFTLITLSLNNNTASLSEKYIPELAQKITELVGSVFTSCQ